MESARRARTICPINSQLLRMTNKAPIGHGSTVNELMNAAFNRPRGARRDAYKAGVESKLSHALYAVSMACPYADCTAECDAFYAGVDEGRAIVRAL